VKRFSSNLIPYFSFSSGNTTAFSNYRGVNNAALPALLCCFPYAVVGLGLFRILRAGAAIRLNGAGPEWNSYCHFVAAEIRRRRCIIRLPLCLFSGANFKGFGLL
jgi:hypothetical protein